MDKGCPVVISAAYAQRPPAGSTQVAGEPKSGLQSASKIDPGKQQNFSIKLLANRSSDGVSLRRRSGVKCRADSYSGAHQPIHPLDPPWPPRTPSTADLAARSKPMPALHLAISQCGRVSL